jgi:hypothetical protein
VLVGVACFLIGSTGGGILWIPKEAVQSHWQTAIAILGGQDSLDSKKA